MKKLKWLLEVILVFIVLFIAIGSMTIMTFRIFMEMGLSVWSITSIIIMGSVVTMIGLNKCVRNKKIVKELHEESRFVSWVGLTLASLMITCIVLMVVFAISRELGVLAL